jgi:hypothetical protein
MNILSISVAQKIRYRQYGNNNVYQILTLILKKYIGLEDLFLITDLLKQETSSLNKEGHAWRTHRWCELISDLVSCLKSDTHRST